MNLNWQPAPLQPQLRADEVHLWRAPLDEAQPDWRAILSEEEQERAERFHFEEHRRRCIAGRALLRMILARYLDIDPAELRFTTGAHGKPALTGAGEWLRFNLSHSGELMLLAVAQAREVGVDLEQIRNRVTCDEIAARYFPEEDAATLRLLPAPEKFTRFYQLWTATEAQLKASGLGLSNGTRAIEPDRWSLLSLTPGADYAAALAVEGGDFQLTCWSWPK